MDKAAYPTYDEDSDSNKLPMMKHIPTSKVLKGNLSNVIEENTMYGMSNKPEYRPEGFPSTSYGGINNSHLSSGSTSQNKSGLNFMQKPPVPQQP